MRLVTLTALLTTLTFSMACSDLETSDPETSSIPGDQGGGGKGDTISPDKESTATTFEVLGEAGPQISGPGAKRLHDLLYAYLETHGDEGVLDVVNEEGVLISSPGIECASYEGDFFCLIDAFHEMEHEEYDGLISYAEMRDDYESTGCHDIFHLLNDHPDVSAMTIEEDTLLQFGELHATSADAAEFSCSINTSSVFADTHPAPTVYVGFDEPQLLLTGDTAFELAELLYEEDETEVECYDAGLYGKNCGLGMISEGYTMEQEDVLLISGVRGNGDAADNLFEVLLQHGDDDLSQITNITVGSFSCLTDEGLVDCTINVGYGYLPEYD